MKPKKNLCSSVFICGRRSAFICGRRSAFIYGRRSVLICGLMAVLLCGQAEAATQRKPPARKQPAHKTAPAPKKPTLDMQALQTQVMLDRGGYSPGEIDGTMGTSTKTRMIETKSTRRTAKPRALIWIS